MLTSRLHHSRRLASIVAGCRATLAPASFDVIKRHGTTIPVILLDDVENKGCKGDVVKVKRGHARNLLIPRKMAAYATPINRLKFDEVIKARKEAVESGAASTSRPKSRKEQQKSATGTPFKQLSEGEVAVFIRSAVATSEVEDDKPASTGAEKLYGSVTAADIKAYFEEEGFAPVEISSIKLESPIKTLGTFPVKVGDVTVSIQVLEDKVK